MHKLPALAAFVLAVFFVTACDDSKSHGVAPTAFEAAGVSADVTAGAPVADPGGNRGCPALAIPVDVTIRAGDLELAVTDVTMRFVTSSGVTMPPVTLPAPVPTSQFGSDLIAARSVRTIPLVVPVGCLNNPTGTVIVVIGTRDGRGRRHSTEVRADVR